MTLLGMNISEISDEGVSFGAAFAKGFSEGFDFDTVSGKLWQGFKGMFSSAGKLLPGGESAGLSSVLSAIVLSKVAKLFIGMAKGGVSIGKGLFGANAALVRPSWDRSWVRRLLVPDCWENLDCWQST